MKSAAEHHSDYEAAITKWGRANDHLWKTIRSCLNELKRRGAVKVDYQRGQWYVEDAEGKGWNGSLREAFDALR